MKKFLLLTICSLFGFLPIIAQNGLAEDGWYEYTVNEGNLSELISEDLKYQITKLRLKGKINGDDLRLIRDMAGLPFQQISYDKGLEIDAQLTDGKLQYLDLGDTEICSGGSFLAGYGFSNGSLGVCIFQHSRSLIEVKGNKITEISSQAFNDCPNLKSVSFPNAIRLYNSVFKNCTSLQSVDLPLVDELYPDVFRECTSLTNVMLPNVKIIHLNCFTQCTSLKTISLPSVTFLRQEVFSRCSALESVTAPNVTKLDDRVFWYCTALRNIELPALKSMGSYVFQFCSSLTSVTLENVEEINGFAGCESLVSVRCSNATRICDYAFQSCVSLETVDCPNVIHIASNAFSNCTSLKEIDWPNVIYIGPNAFSSCTSLKLIHIPNIEEIEERAFSGCETLSIANITSVKKIGDRAFFMCKLEDVSLPKVKKIGELVFYKNKLSTVEIGEYLDTIGYQAFSNTEIIRINNKKVPVISPNEGYIEPYNSGSFAKGLANIGTIIVPSESCNSYKNAEHWSEFSIRIIPDDAETHITADVEAQESTSGLLKNVGEEKLQNAIRLTLKGTINGYDIMLIRNKMPNLHFLDLTDVSIKANPYEYYQGYHSEDHRIGGYMFNGLHKLVELILPNNITYIGKNAFENCQFLKRITMYPGITNIDSYALSACKSLKRLVIPSGVLSINQHAFSSCEELDTVIIDEGLRVLGSQCFSWCYQLKHIQIPNSLEEIDRFCFQDCRNLANINMPENLHTIGDYAFQNCNSLTELVFPKKLRTLGRNSFSGCEGLLQMHISPMIETIGEEAFSKCSNVKDVYVYIANAKDIKINQNTFCSWTTSRLHVPNFAYNTYYWDTQWSQFAQLDEFDDKYESFYSKNTITLDKNTGTITGTPNATLHENGGLIVNDEEKQELDEIQLKSDGTNGATLIPENTGNIKAKKVDITIKVKGNKWHFFCFPFDVPLSGMAYEGEYVWRRYDGAKRSRREGGWQNLAAGTTTLEAGRGYIFQGTADGELTLSIDNPEITASDVKTGLEVHPSDNSQDASWNFVGNPYVSYYSIDATTYSSPITIWNGTGYEAYRPGDDDYMFHPYQAFFVQTPVDASEIGFDATARESFEQSQTSLASAKARRAARKMNVNRLLANLELFAAGDTTYMDKTRIVFNDKENMEYDAVSDAAKFMSSERAAEFYTMDSKNVQYAINERPMAGGDVRMGFIANKAGEYRIAQSRSDVEMLLVDHQEGITHNLGTGAYAFSSGEGTFENRFTLKVNGQETGITELKEKTGIDLTVDGELCINGAAEEVSTTVYQLNGVLAGTIQGNGSLRLPKGVYAVKVGLLTLKIQI